MTYGCAFCGEENEVLVDPSGARRQTFTEDCTVCCRPNLITLTFDVTARGETTVSVPQVTLQNAQQQPIPTAAPTAQISVK